MIASADQNCVGNPNFADYTVPNFIGDPNFASADSIASPSTNNHAAMVVGA